jgi:hypothetical protein
MQTLKIIGLLLVILVAVGAVVYQAQQLYRKPSPLAEANLPQIEGKMKGQMGAGPGMGMPGMGQGGGQTLGNKDAKVVIEAAVPLGPECHRKTLKLLQALVKEEPKRVYVKIISHESPEGMALVSKRGTHCASVFVNEQFKFDLPDGPDKTRHVEFWHRPNDPDSLYHSEDVIDAVHLKLVEKYGKGLEESVIAKIKAAGKEETGEG